MGTVGLVLHWHLAVPETYWPWLSGKYVRLVERRATTTTATTTTMTVTAQTLHVELAMWNCVQMSMAKWTSKVNCEPNIENATRHARVQGRMSGRDRMRIRTLNKRYFQSIEFHYTIVMYSRKIKHAIYRCKRYGIYINKACKTESNKILFLFFFFLVCFHLFYLYSCCVSRMKGKRTDKLCWRKLSIFFLLTLFMFTLSLFDDMICLPYLRLMTGNEWGRDCCIEISSVLYSVCCRMLSILFNFEFCSFFIQCAFVACVDGNQHQHQNPNGDFSCNISIWHVILFFFKSDSQRAVERIKRHIEWWNGKAAAGKSKKTCQKPIRCLSFRLFS